MIINGFHGTSSDRLADIERLGLQESSRRGLWLGRGRYFFQDAPYLALLWAKECSDRRSRKLGFQTEPIVLRAKIDLTNCLNLTDASHWRQLQKIRKCYEAKSIDRQMPLVEMLQRQELAINEWPKEDTVILLDYIMLLESLGQNISTIKATIPEGQPIFERSWYLDKASVMINVLCDSALIDLEHHSVSNLGTI